MLRLLPALIVGMFLAMLAMGIGSQRPAPSSKAIQKPLPSFSLPLIYEEGNLTDADLKGHYSLINIFASWCYTCRLEHDALLNLAEQNRIAIYGITWKDKPVNTKQWLANLGNPYAKVASDYSGELAVPLGLMGTPETFLVNPEGMIIYHHQGMLTEDFLERNILSLMQ